MSTTDESERAFSAWVRQNAPRAFAVAYFRCGNRHFAEEITQEAFLKFWKAMPNVAAEARWTYLHRILVNVHLDHLRKASRRPKELRMDDERVTRIPGDCDVAEEATFAAFSRDLRAAVATLDERQRELVYYIYFEQLSVRAAGRTIGLSESTARRYHADALSRLGKLLNCAYEEDQDA